MSAHPLDPLTADEATTASRVLRESGQLPEGTLYPLVTLAEPAKAALLAWRDGDPIDRQLRYLCWHRETRAAYEALVSATHERVVSVEPVPGVQPLYLLFAELYMGIELIKADERWQAALKRRGVDNLDLIQIDPWPAGSHGLDFEEGGKRRLLRAVTYVLDDPGDNAYAHPVENLVVIVDLDQMEVVDVQDGEAVPIPRANGRYDAEHVGPMRTTVKPLEITQPEGPSFTLDGTHLSWEKWDLRFDLHPIEGLVIHQANYDGRPVLHRASIAEMVVPYASTAMNSWWKNTYDAGEMSIGKLVNSLVLGCDCLGEIRYVDATIVDENGNPYVIPQAICLHEEDFGILWKHTDLMKGSVEVRRSRRMVLSAIHTVGNYEYGFYWYLYQDGRLQLEIKLSGIVQTEAVPDGAPAPKHGAIIDDHLVSPHHQHMFSIRLDLDVDGTDCQVLEVDAIPVPMGSDNPHGNAWVSRETLIASERDGKRQLDTASGRHWRIVSSTQRNGLGQPTGYSLLPHVGPMILNDPSSHVSRRAGFASAALWVTAYDDREMHAAGDYPNQNAGADGLPRWVQQDRNLDGADVVLWHTIGVTHVARPEDWPVMPTEYAGFTLKPYGFFDRNPALDVPPSHACHTEESSS
ncbi:MAG: primary-amine oxidase [Frankiales bacterium]|jgi:primary-amine oxidase|nr:primary-amine oxidase [Frankiales bacterium]